MREFKFDATILAAFSSTKEKNVAKNRMSVKVEQSLEIQKKASGQSFSPYISIDERSRQLCETRVMKMP